MKLFFSSLTFTFLFLISIQADYQPFVNKQLILIHQMEDDNITQKRLKVLVKQQENIYRVTLEKLLLDKNILLNKALPYKEEIFVLQKVLKHNKKRGDKWAILRDEVQLKSYKMLQQQRQMSKKTLRALDYYEYNKFIIKMTDYFVENQEAIQKINTVDYEIYLKTKATTDIMIKIQKNIRDYYAILELNIDMISYLSRFEKRMYRLNKYAKYHLLPMALYLDYTEFGKILNSILYPYNLSIMKLIVMFFISLLLYFLRTQVYRVIKTLLAKIPYLHKYINEMLESSYYPINIFFITINIEMIIYIYHNFATIKIVSTFFNIIYALFFTLILYRIINTIASIRLEDINIVGKKIKNEMINVALKIINFLILIMGILLVMHFAGANLATVLSGLGIGGFAIAFAARESLANFLGTISILMSDIFSQGDWIVVNNSEGTVVEIGLRVTTLRTFDNALIAIPNGTIANNDVKNWSRRTLGRRIKLSLGIKYDSKPVDIRNAITQIRQMLQEHNGIATTKTNYTYEKHKRTKLVSQEDSVGVKRTLLVYLDTLSDSSITILVYCFTKTIDWNQWLETKEDVIYKIMDILETNHLEFAYPSLSIYHENDSIQT
jgi:MscS family membrane protein